MKPFLMHEQKGAKEELKFLIRNNTGPRGPHARVGETGLVAQFLFSWKISSGKKYILTQLSSK